MSSSPILVFDIETIPATQDGAKCFDLGDLSPKAAGEALFARYRKEDGSAFLPHHLQQVAAISILLAQPSGVKVWSLGEMDATEPEIIQRFFNGIEKYNPILVSWNGSGFDLPVLHYRALRHGIQAPRYWEMGESDQQFRWNNYINRYHFRHLDLMDVLAGYQPRASAPLQNIALMLGLPGKMGMDGSRVWDAYLAGDIQSIRDYCETDVLNTYLVYCHFEWMRGHFTQATRTAAFEAVKTCLKDNEAPHLQAFLAQWEAGS